MIRIRCARVILLPFSIPPCSDLWFPPIDCKLTSHPIHSINLLSPPSLPIFSQLFLSSN